MTRTTRRRFLELGAAGAAGAAIARISRATEPGAQPALDERVVFTPARIGRLSLANRLVRASTAEGAAPDGAIDESGVELYRRLAAGGVGMILTGHMVAVRGGDAHGRQTHIDDDCFIPSLERLTAAAHETAPGCAVVAQISHAGPAGIVDPIAPSEVAGRPGGRPPRVLAASEIDDIIAQFSSAAQRAAAAGFDGVEIHAAHGYLLASFLSPRINRRDDAFGGSAERRFAVVRAIIGGIRTRLGAEYPVLIKMNGDDQGSPEAFAAVARLTVGAGVDAIEVSGRMPCRPGVDSPDEEAYFRRFADALGDAVPVILTGGHRSLARSEELLAHGPVDFVGLARPLIRQPDLPARWRDGGDDLASCISCNRCLQILGTATTHCVYQEMIDRGEVA